MLALWRKRRIVQTGDKDFHNRVAGALAVLGIVIGKFNSVHIRRNSHSAIWTFQPGKIRQAIKSKMKLRHKAITAQSINSTGKLDLEIFLPDQIQKRAFRIG